MRCSCGNGRHELESGGERVSLEVEGDFEEAGDADGWGADGFDDGNEGAEEEGEEGCEEGEKGKEAEGLGEDEEGVYGDEEGKEGEEDGGVLEEKVEEVAREEGAFGAGEKVGEVGGHGGL